MIIPGTRTEASYKDLEHYTVTMMESFQVAVLTKQLVLCELQKVDSGNEIFNYSEGVVDKGTLYLVRKTLKEGSYEKLRDKCRIPVRSQNLKPGDIR